MLSFFFFYYVHSLFLIFCKNHFFFISPQEKISFSVFVLVKLIGVISMLLQVLVHMAHIWEEVSIFSKCTSAEPSLWFPDVITHVCHFCALYCTLVPLCYR